MGSLGLITIILFGMSCATATCTGNSAASCAPATDCVWQPGSCTPFSNADCNSVNCKIGCKYTAPVSGSCQDSTFERCATGANPTSCGALTGCMMSAVSCVASNSLAASCPDVVENYCPDGCESVDVPVCESSNSGSEVINCGAYSVTPATECSSFGDCKWEGNTCVPNQGSGNSTNESGNLTNGSFPGSDNYCEELTNEPISECTSGGGEQCKISSGLCVYDSSSSSEGRTCDSLSTTPGEVSACIEYGCTISGGKCVSGNSSSGNSTDWCEELSTSVLSECEMASYINCIKQGNKCVFNDSVLEKRCNDSTLEYCTYSSNCIVQNGKCIFRGNYNCGLKSTVPLSQCTMQSWSCKTSGSSCVALTADELCSRNSVIPQFSECEINGCYVSTNSGNDTENSTQNGTQASYCYGNQDLCSDLSTTPIVSACAQSPGCAVSSYGSCVSAPIPICTMNQGKTACNNPASDGCVFYTKRGCKVVEANCGRQLSSSSCNSQQYYNNYNFYQSCTWDTSSGICVPESESTICSVNYDGTCSDPGPSCDNTPAIDEDCTVDPAVSNCNMATTSACNAATGCKWNATVGGICAPLTCGDSPNYKRCCEDTNTPGASCPYCSGLSIPGDCPNVPTVCTRSPSYSNCCPGTGTECTDFCTLYSQDGGCVSSGIGQTPEPTGQSHNVVAPFMALLILLILL